MSVRIINADVATLAYCAGVIDADGTIGIKRSTYAMRVRGDASTPVFSERVCVKQVTPEAVDLLRSVFGGSRYGHKPGADKGKPLHVWHVTDLQAYQCLVALLPYLRIKRNQAENCIALRAVKEQSKRERVAVGRGHAGAAERPVHLTSKMEVLYLEGKSLNRVGVQL